MNELRFSFIQQYLKKKTFFPSTNYKVTDIEFLGRSFFDTFIRMRDDDITSTGVLILCWSRIKGTGGYFSNSHEFPSS